MQPQKIRIHLLKYWERSKSAFAANDFPLATFLAITLIEEVGKIIILGNEKLGGELDKKGLSNHKKKYMHAVYSALYINHRVTKIYGEFESKFANWFRNDKLFEIRNSALYLEKEGQVTPEEAINAEDTSLIVCIAGEVLADIQGGYLGTGPDDWHNLIEDVDSFRKKYNLFEPYKTDV